MTDRLFDWRCNFYRRDGKHGRPGSHIGSEFDEFVIAGLIQIEMMTERTAFIEFDGGRYFVKRDERGGWFVRREST